MKKKRKIPPLFHYTTQAGLSGIINSQSLWFTDIFYLNDATEFEYTFNLVNHQLELREKEVALMGSNNEHIIKFIKDFSLYEFIKEYVGLYVFSFSRKQDDLSQWRAYSNDGGGYCIEFDANKILEIASERKWEKTECMYNEQKQREQFKNIIDKTITACKNNKNEELIKRCYYQAIQIVKLTSKEKETLNKIQKGFFLKLLKLAPKLKHESFLEEAEFRLYMLVKKSKGMSLEFRPGKTMLIPYRKIKIADNGEEMPINRIIIGPTNHPELSKKAVNDLLMAHSIECEVVLSEIPYRGIL